MHSTVIHRRSWMPYLLICVILIPYIPLAWTAAWRNGQESDIVRQWVVCQYVQDGRDPYVLSHKILLEKYGETNISKAKVYRIPMRASRALAKEILPLYGPPESTYPPSTIGLLMLVIGWMPTSEIVLAAWTIFNFILLLCAAQQLSRWAMISAQERIQNCFAWMLVLVLLFSPFFQTIRAGQFSVLCLSCLLFAFHDSTNAILRGFALGIALIKPSIALPFVLAECIKGRWISIGVALGVQGLGMGIVVLATGANPLTLIYHWLATSKYFVDSMGMYTVQEIINRFGWQSEPVGLIIRGLFYLFAVGMIVFCRRAPDAYRIAFVCIVSMLWIYHGPYDFVFALTPLIILFYLKRRVSIADFSFSKTLLPQLLLVISFTALSVALAPPVYEGDGLITRILRWLGRFALVYLLLELSRVFIRGRNIASRPVTFVK